MKKLIAMILIACMACMLIPAMADEDVTGEWYGSLMGMGIVLSFNADGTFTMVANGQEMAKGNWTLEGTTITATGEDEIPETFELKDGNLYNEKMDMTMTRNPEDAPAVIEIAEVKADAAAEEFYGEWTPKALEMDGMVFDIAVYTEQAEGDVLPNLTIGDGVLQFAAEGMIGTMFSMLPLESAYADGKITASVALGETALEVTVEMLVDGTIKVTMITDSPMILYYAPAAAAEEPAA